MYVQKLKLDLLHLVLNAWATLLIFFYFKTYMNLAYEPYLLFLQLKLKTPAHFHDFSLDRCILWFEIFSKNSSLLVLLDNE